MTGGVRARLKRMVPLMSQHATLKLDLLTASKLLPDNSFVGRQQELAVLKRAFESGRRLITIAGIGGAGKTRLALEFARSFTDSAIFIDLSSAREVSDLTIAMADVLSGRCPDESPDGIAAGLATLDNATFVLDTVEGLLPEACPLISQWHRNAPGVRFLVTSRIPLGAASEQVILLTALDPVDSLTLLVDRASALNFRFDATEDPQHLQRVLEQLEGIPLAIELAAARTQTLSPKQLSQRLEEPLRVLRSHLRDVSPRHAAMEATLEWSWELLTEAERTVLTRLLAFRSSFSLQAAEAVIAFDWARPGSVISVIESLVQHGLLRLIETASGRRLRLLGVVRDYISRHLSDDERDASERQHTRYFIELVEPLMEGDGFAKQQLDECDPLLVPEIENLEAIVERPAVTIHERVVATLALVAILARQGPATRLQRVLDRTTECLEASAEVPSMETIRLNLAHAFARRILGTPRPSADELERSYHAALEAGLLSLAASLQYFHARTVLLGGDMEGAVPLFKASYELALKSQCNAAIALCVQGPAIVPFRRGHFDDALVAAKEVLAVADRVGYRRVRWIWRQNLAIALFEVGQIEDALQSANQVRVLMGESESLDLMTINLSLLAEFSVAAGKPQDKQRWLSETQKLWNNKALRSAHPKDGIHGLRCWLALAERDLEAAEAAIAPEQWHHLPHNNGAKQAVAESCRGLIAMLRGNPSAAIPSLTRSMSVRRRISTQRIEALLDQGFLALARAMSGDREGARKDLEETRRPDYRSLRLQQTMSVLNVATRTLLAEPEAIAEGRAALASMRRGDGPWKGYMELVVAAQLLEDALTDLDEQGHRTLRVGEDLAWVQVDSSPTLDLQRRRVPQRLIRCLLQARERSTVDVVPTDSLLSAAWPNDKASRASLENRLWATLSKLRRAGLDGVIERIEGGYRIHPEVKVEQSTG